MKYKLLSCLALAGCVLAGGALAADMDKGQMQQKMKTAPISKVADVNNMADDTMVYVQGYLVENLGDEQYVFQDNSGKINVEIDDDMIQGNVAPNAPVWIAATVDNEDGEPVMLEAEEIQFLPSNMTTSMNNSAK